MITGLILVMLIKSTNFKTKDTFSNLTLEWALCCIADAIWYYVLFKS